MTRRLKARGAAMQSGLRRMPFENDYDDGDSLYYPELRKYSQNTMSYSGGRLKRFFVRFLLCVLLLVLFCSMVDYADYSETCDICGADAPFEICVTGRRITKGSSTIEKLFDLACDFMRDNTKTYHFCESHYSSYIEWQRGAARR